MARIKLRTPLMLVALMLQAQEWADPTQGMLTVSMCAGFIFAFSVIAFVILRRRDGAAHALLTRVPTPLRFFLIITVFIAGLYGAFLFRQINEIFFTLVSASEIGDTW